MSVLLFIVSRHQRGVYEHLVRQFADEPDMQVLLDRRTAQRRQRSRPVSQDRRQADRRRNTEAIYQLLTTGYAFVRPGAGPS